MPASTAPAAKAAILTALATRPVLADVSRSWGGPVSDDDYTDEMIYLGDVTVEGEWVAFGANRRDEEYTVQLSVHALKYGAGTEQATEERAWTLLAEVSAALTADKYLGGLMRDAVALDTIKQTNIPTPEQWATLIVAQIHCVAAFTP